MAPSCYCCLAADLRCWQFAFFRITRARHLYHFVPVDFSNWMGSEIMEQVIDSRALTLVLEELYDIPAGKKTVS